MSKPMLGLCLDNRLDYSNINVWLPALKSMGIDCIEIDNFNHIYLGERLNPLALRELKAGLKRHSMAITLHGPHEIDFRSETDLLLYKRWFCHSLQLLHELEGGVVVTHFGRRSDEQSRERQFAQSMAEMADEAKKLGVYIGLENQEIDCVQPVIDLIKQIDNPYFRMTLDLGHAFLASGRFGFDFLEAVDAALPWLRHVHLQDNYGQFDEDRLYNRQRSFSHRLPLAKGDVHLPVGWGKIPYDQVAERLNKSYNGVYMLEYTVGMQAEILPEIISESRKILIGD